MNFPTAVSTTDSAIFQKIIIFGDEKNIKLYPSQMASDMQTNVSIGIDIGGTNTVIGLIDQAGKCYMEECVPTRDFNKIQDLVDELYRIVLEKQEQLGVTPIGVGMGAPNGNYFNGTIESPANLKWKGTIPIVEMLEKKFRIPAYVTNDAKAAAIGEMIYGGAKGMKNFVVITLGTGLGCGIVVNGDLIYGHDGLAGELGHIIVKPGGRACNCGRSWWFSPHPPRLAPNRPRSGKGNWRAFRRC